MQLTDAGKKVLTLNDYDKNKVYYDLVNGHTHIREYLHGAVCYDAVVFVRYLKKFKPLFGPLNESYLEKFNGQGWLSILKFNEGIQWTQGAIEPGLAIGFARVENNGSLNFFHASIATQGVRIRGENSVLLSPDWLHAVDLAKLGHPNNQGLFEFDNRLIGVYISRY